MRIQDFPIFNISQEIDASLCYSCVKRKDPRAIYQCIKEISTEQKVFNTLIHSFHDIAHFAVGYIKDSQVRANDLGSDYLRFVFFNNLISKTSKEQKTWDSPISGIIFKGTYLTLPILLEESEPLDLLVETAPSLKEALKQHNLRKDSRFVFVQYMEIVKQSKDIFEIFSVDIEPISEHHADIDEISRLF